VTASPDTALVPEVVQRFDGKLEPWQMAAAELEVVDQAALDYAQSKLMGIAALKKEIVDAFSGPKQQALTTHRAIVALERRFLQPLEECDLEIRGKVRAFLLEEQATQKRAEAEAAAAARKAQEEAEAEAAELAAAGEPELAEIARAEAAEHTPPQVPMVQAAKASNISTTDHWVATVTDKMALIKMVAEGRAQPALLEVDMKVLGGLARSLKNELKLDGVEVKNEPVVKVRR